MNRKKNYLLAALTAFVNSVAADQVLPAADSAIGGIGSYLSKIFMFPGFQGGPRKLVIWIGALLMIFYGFKRLIESFGNRINAGLSSTDEWVFGIALSLCFIGTTNVIGWVTNLLTLMKIGFILAGLAAVLYIIRGGGSLFVGQISGFFQSIFGWSTSGMTGAFGYAAFDNLAPSAGGAVEDAWDEYKDWPKCDNGHRNPQHKDKAPGSGPHSCWVTSCKQDVTIP